jgi:death-on-curing family protein
MDELTAESIIALHTGIIERDGGDARLLSEASLHQMVFQANLMDTAFRRAACALYWLCSYPVFREGNRRTALLATGIVLASEGYEADLEGRDMIQLTEGIGSFAIGMDDVEDWLCTHSRRRA